MTASASPTHHVAGTTHTDSATVSVDPLLNAVIDAVEMNEGFTLGITLYVGGVMVSGTMISYRTYLEGVGKTFQTAGEGSPSAYATQLGKMISDAASHGGHARATGHRFINLEGVRVLSPGSPLMPSNGFWRGSAAAVDGYAWGVLK
jgi:hypothetical protein